jgi:hypothetical protein
MATEDTPPQNAAELTPQQIADQIAAQQAGGEPPQLQREYVVQTSTGAVFRGRTQQDLIDQMQKSVEHGSAKIKQQEDELAQLRAQMQQPAAYQQPPQQQEAWNPQRYFELWAQDPNLAEDYRYRANLGVSQAELAEQIRQAYDFTTRTRPQLAVDTWIQNSDFPSQDLTQKQAAAGHLQQVWNEFFPGDDEITPQKLELAHSVAVRRGLYQPENVQNGGVPPPQAAQGQSPLPTLNMGSTVPVTGQQDINRMTPEQLRVLMEQMR